jgi:hypothetical protein
MMNFRRFLFKEEEQAYSSAYMNALSRIETMVGGFRPYGFSPDADEEAYRARSDVMEAIQELHRKARRTIGVNRPRHVA